MVDLDEDKIVAFKEVFDLFDKDKDGAIDTKELGIVLRANGVNITEAEISELMNEMDSNGKVEFKEMLQLYDKKEKENFTEEELLDAFKLFDKDGTGTITSTELNRIMTTMGETFTDEEADALLKELDPDSSGTIDYHEFINIVLGK